MLVQPIGPSNTKSRKFLKMAVSYFVDPIDRIGRSCIRLCVIQNLKRFLAKSGKNNCKKCAHNLEIVAAKFLRVNECDDVLPNESHAERPADCSIKRSREAVSVPVGPYCPGWLVGVEFIAPLDTI